MARSKKKQGETGMIVSGSDQQIEGPKPWERRPGESLVAYHAFETYLQLGIDRSHAGVAERIGKKKTTVAKLSSKNQWVKRIDAWEAEQSKIRLRAAEAKIAEMAERQALTGANMVIMASNAITRWANHLKKHKDELLPLKEIAQLVRVGAELELKARGILALEDPAVQAAYVRASMGRGGGAIEETLLGREGGGGIDLEELARERWTEQYIQPEGSFLPHRRQSAAIRSLARFCVLVAGIQSGKTTGGAIRFWKKIQDDRAKIRKRVAEGGKPGFYWMIAPNAPIGEVMCEAFVTFAPEGEIVKSSGQSSNRMWTLRDGTRVQFRSGEHADKLVGRTVDGAWLDEFTILKEEVWTVSVRQRLAATGGWCIFTGTPRGQNWAYHQIWRAGLKQDDVYDDEFEGFTWPSSENPRIDPKEVESARRQLAPAYFRREWEASWEAFHGQIYTGWTEAYEVKGLASRPVPQGSRTYGGKDFGFSNPGCLLTGHLLPNGQWWIVDEVYGAEHLPGWWVDEVAGVWQRLRVEKFWMDPAEPGQIAGMVEEGIPAESAPNAVGEGIRLMASLITQGRVLVDPEKCPNLCSQIRSYKWAEDSRGRKEQPEKENDHAVDAARYLFMGERAQRPPAKVSGYGSAKRKR